MCPINSPLTNSCSCLHQAKDVAKSAASRIEYIRKIPNLAGFIDRRSAGRAMRGRATARTETAKDCTAEWRADKAGMQARGITEKAYVEQCKGGAEPTAATPASKPADAAPSQPRQATSTGSKTAKD